MAKHGPVRIMRGVSVEHYHTVPGELELLTVTPEQQAIFQYLSTVGPDRFQEFVADVLVHTQGHTLVDITGGPGDEKQDILTATPEGQRQLTQCKHTINFGARSSGDDLDQMFSAAFRKNCQVALYVTNGDLTPQAKRYVNDQEYLRGSRVDPELVPSVHYWNGRNIWAHIASHAQLLNKWFSGAAQVHGLRTVAVRIVSTRMPEREVQDCEPERVLAAFDGNGGKFTLTADTWFTSADEVPGAAGKLTWNSPIPALRVQLTQTTAGLFAVDEAVTAAGAAALSSLGKAEGWFHQYVSAPSSVLVVHDLQRPVMCEIGKARFLVKVGEVIEDELVWGFDPGAGFVRDEEEELSWRHELTGTEWSMAVEQPIGFQEGYGIKLRQEQLIRSAVSYTFWMLEDTRRNQELVLSLVSVQGMVLQHGEHLLLALPLPVAESTAQQFESFCARNEVPYRKLDDEERQIVLSQVEEIPAQEAKLVSSMRELQSPINLTTRFAVLNRKLTFPRLSLRGLSDMLVYKWEWEQKRGFDALAGQTSAQLGTEELRGRLFDIQSFRGSHMLDIGVGKKELLLYVRRIVNVPDRASSIAAEMMNDLEQIVEDLKTVVLISASADSDEEGR